MIASVHGGCFPWWAHGSRVTTMVAPRARSPAPASATASACRSPNSGCHPSPTSSPFLSTTAPTNGFGWTRPQPRQARSRARAIASRSFTSLEAHSQAQAGEELPLRGVEILELSREPLILPPLITELASEPELGHADP